MKEIKKLNKNELYNWLKTEAGVNNGIHFGAFEGGLELQQIPEEYIEYLWFLKNRKSEKYLNIGIGNDGSFMVETYIQSDSLKRSVAVDNTSYGVFTNIENINYRINWLKENTNILIDFFNMNSIEYFKNNDEKFDTIFIDGDHSYDGVKLDYDYCLNLLNDNGVMIFHDIASLQCPGVVKLWNEIKNERCIEFIRSNKCGIGIYIK